jgi:putative effector of murein hydrolase
MAFSCIYLLYPGLVHPFHFASFYLIPYMVVISTSLKILYQFLYRMYINHTHLLNFLFYPSPVISAFPLG